MTKLLQKDVKFEWSEKCQKSFDQLKAHLTKALVLVQPKSSKEFVIYSDASLNGLGCVLMQEGKVIAYASRQLKPHEKNYPTHDLELAAIKDLNLRQRRWLELLKDYELVFDYHLGKANVVADALSQKSLFALRAMNAHMKVDNELIAKRAQCDSNADLEFQVDADNCLRFRNRICIPRNTELIQMTLNEAHNSRLSVHLGSSNMYNDLKQHYWWQGMKRDVSNFVLKCLVCQQVKAEHQVPSRLLQPIMIPEWKWDKVTMDFVFGLPMTSSKKDAIWVFVDRLTKSAHFVPVHTDYSLDKLAGLYVSQIVRLHGTDGQSERIIQILEDMLRCCILEFEGTWERYLPLVEFTYNNSFQPSIKTAPYEALYGRKCRTPLYWTKLSENKMHGVDLVRETEQKVNVICESLEAALDRQKSLLLSSELEKIHNVFHVSMLQRYRSDPSHVIIPSEIEIQSDLTDEEELIRILAHEIKELRNKKILLVKYCCINTELRKQRGSQRIQ
ncbi:hypothetical protein CXB51_019177 [Gossypium anomalum]|uniref:DNA/RNA polymerases superfamily protein n=1 Tax=Gossypium anomalum TaxID=47600 RepID=A0A8J5YKG4_9ROSI|nr:hypothetical protein CXB51_019177 [Gossypium anomalum]